MPGVNPLTKVRDGTTAAWRKSRDGTKRTASWVKDGTTGAFGKVRERTSSSTGAARDGVGGAWDRVGGGRLAHRARQDNRFGAALIIGAIVLVLWIAWTVYVWIENGSTAGLGVLISWPAVIAAVALIAAPFVAAGVLIKRMAANGGPSLAIAGGGTTETAAAKADEEQGSDPEEGKGSDAPEDKGSDPEEDSDEAA